MPISFEKKLPDDSRLALWQIEEDEEFFLSELILGQGELDQLNRFKASHRRLEWLAVRLLLKEMLGKKASIAYDDFGRPVLKDHPGFISISHSKQIAGIYFHPDKHPGLDIEIISGKVEKVKHKFLSTEEMEQIGESDNIEKLVLYWCAKECLLKITGHREIDFIKELTIHPFTYTNEGSFYGDIRFGEIQSSHHLKYCRHNNYMVVYAS
ncbi:MAG: 4'-phosphopantetheinyl transferase superfamily protein [Bacteroidales bacterium]|nr:4'-phosphopantetheinyl transferase superfamily protein [Bacteroidales bacterium]MCF8455956.1 4'-phosphopantetheinyl transferase superfamily protein [Bacteroidales bacterium]